MSTLHIAWGLVLLISGIMLPNAALATTERLIPDPHVLGVVFLASGLLGLRALTHHVSRGLRWLELLPQQFFVALAALGALQYVAAGQLSTIVHGPPAPTLLLLGVQASTLLLAGFYGWAVRNMVAGGDV